MSEPVCDGTTDLPYGLDWDEFDHLRSVWMSRRMFGFVVGMHEWRTFDEWLDAVMEARAALTSPEART